MRFKSLITLILTVSLAVITSNAMAKSDKSGKSDKSAEYSQKSDKSAKSGKSRKGNGYGHCKSDKSGKGHKKKRGKGHDRDCDDDDDSGPELTCVATARDVSETIKMSAGRIPLAESITFEGPVCTLDIAAGYEATIITDSGVTQCELISDSDSSVVLNQNSTNIWYDMTTVLTCRAIPGGPF